MLSTSPQKAGYEHFEIIQLGDDVLQEDVKQFKEQLWPRGNP